MTETALILGANGRFGHHAAQAFRQAGWHIVPFERTRDDLEASMARADVTLMGWNPPGYQLWAEQMLPLHQKVARAAARTGSTVIIPGNVYVFGPDAPTPWGPDTPHLAQNPLGLLRQQAEAAYREAGARAILLRCGDFIDTRAGGNWFEAYLAKKARKGSFAYPGDPDAPHAWAFLPDAARAAVALAERRAQLSAWEDVPFAGFTLSGRQMAQALTRALGREVKLSRFAWAPLQLLRPFMPVLKGVQEMRYLWSLPHELDGTKLAGLLPDFTPTPLEEALRAATAWQQ